MKLHRQCLLIMLVMLLMFSSTLTSLSASEPVQVSLRINGSIVNSDVPPVIVSRRTLVPVRIISESLGWNVEWLPASRQVLITKSDNLADGYLLLTLDDPRVMVNGEERTLDVPPIIMNQRTMVPIRFVAEAFDSEVDWDADTRTVYVASTVMNPIPDPPPKEVEEAPAVPLAVDLHYDQDSLELLLDPSMTYQVVRDGDTRVLIMVAGRGFPQDLMGTRNYPEGPVERVNVRSGVTDQETFVIIDLRDGAEFRIQEQNTGIALQFLRLKRIEVDYNSAGPVVRLWTNLPMVPRSFTLKSPHRVVVDLPGAELAPEVKNYLSEDDLLAGYRLGRHRRSMGDPFDGVRVVLDLHEAYVPHVTHQAGDDGYEIRVVFRESASLANRLIVIDPGHGGSDPGATGVSGVKEKVINLMISSVVVDRLRAAGATVVVTRTGDDTVDIYDRPKLANGLNADVFISIHNNADPRRKAQGTETYYHTRHSSQSDSARLARIIHDQIVSVIGRPDRGVRTANFAVLRESKMPAVLLEIVYMTCPEDESVLYNANTPTRVADALVVALQRYFAAP